MKWQKDKLKDLIKARGLTQDRLAEEIGVSRQTVASWFVDRVPKGLHLMKLWAFLGLEPGALFLDEKRHYITRAMYHTIEGSRSFETAKKMTEEIAALYAVLFPKEKSSPLQPVILSKDAGSAQIVSMVFRKLMGIAEDSAPTFFDILSLMQRLGVCVIPRSIPSEVVADAFYVTINFSRVIFVNWNGKLSELARAMVHESVHALRPVVEDDVADAEISREEKFCEEVVKFVWGKRRNTEQDRTLEELMFSMGEVSQYAQFLQKHFSVWYETLKEQAGSISVSKLSEMLDVSHTDAAAFQKFISADVVS